MEVDAVGTEVGESPHRLDWVEWRADFEPERVPSPVADRPQPEREPVGRRRRVGIAHHRQYRAQTARRAPGKFTRQLRGTCGAIAPQVHQTFGQSSS